MNLPKLVRQTVRPGHDLWCSPLVAGMQRHRQTYKHTQQTRSARTPMGAHQSDVMLLPISAAASRVRLGILRTALVTAALGSRRAVSQGRFLHLIDETEPNPL